MRQIYFSAHGSIFLNSFLERLCVQMMTPMETYLRRGQRRMQRWWSEPRVRMGTRLVFCGLSGFVLSAVSLMGRAQPLAMGLAAALTGWQALAAGLGALVGYRLYWGQSGFPGVFWTLGSCMTALLLGKREEAREQPLLIPALCALMVSASGVAFQLLGREDSGLPVYLLRVVLSALSAFLFRRVAFRRNTLTDWLAWGVGVLALSRASPVPWLNPGAAAAAMLAVGGSFPAAAIAGIGMDLADVTALPMAAVLCMAYLTRMIPGKQRFWRAFAPAGACFAAMAVLGRWDISLLPGLLAGGALGLLMPPRIPLHHRRGETGLAQVRLELSARVLQETRQQLLEPRGTPVDVEAILEKVRQTACGSCSARANCETMHTLSPVHLEHPGDALCRKPGRLLPELHRGQEQLRHRKADRQRREEYRQALAQQYEFLAVYLQGLADLLPRRGERFRTNYSVQCAARSAGKEAANGDRCLAFPGTGGKYYVLLCDGMGTGLGAAREGDTAAAQLRRMLIAGFPAEHALRSLNSFLILQGNGGAVTMDLAQLDLCTGAAVLYKWGAAPSWILKTSGPKKIGTATPPPGLAMEGARESAVQLSLRGGEVLILLSDGVEAGETLGRMELVRDAPPGELAQAVLEAGCSGEDDATVAAVRLRRLR